MEIASTATNSVATQEYKLLAKKISEIDSKLTNVFKRTISIMFSLSIVSSLLIVGAITTVTLLTAGHILSGTAGYAIFAKCAIIFGLTLELFTMGVIVFVAMNLKNVAEKHPV